MAILEIEEINKISLNDNDILLVKVPDEYPRDSINYILSFLENFEVIKGKVIVCPKHFEFTKIEKSGYFEQYFKDHSK